MLSAQKRAQQECADRGGFPTRRSFAAKVLPASHRQIGRFLSARLGLELHRQDGGGILTRAEQLADDAAQVPASPASTRKTHQMQRRPPPTGVGEGHTDGKPTTHVNQRRRLLLSCIISSAACTDLAFTS